MKQLFRLIGALVCLVGLSASAQTTNVTASNIIMAGTPVAAGTVTMFPTNYTGGALSVTTTAGKLYDGQGFTAAIISGAISGTLSVPDACTSSATVANTEIYYQATIVNTATRKTFTISRIPYVCGATWALDQYVPTQGAPVTATGLLSGPTVPNKCTGTSVFYTQSVTPAYYVCTAGSYVQITGSGGAGAQGPQGPAGPTGATGATGSAATVAVGTVTTGAAGTNAAVINSGTSSAAVLNFTIPKGDTGASGSGSASVMGASGSSHASGLVPDPGATAGATKYLREDGTWTTPFNDSTTNTSITYRAGSNGDSSCPTPTAGQDITCYFASINANKRSVNGTAYQPVPTPVLTTKGDLATFDTAATRLSVGTDGQVLTADSTQAAGVKWTTPASGGSGGGPGYIMKFSFVSIDINHPSPLGASNTYTLGDLAVPLLDGNAGNSIIVPKACTVKRITYSFFAVNGMPAPSGLHATFVLWDQSAGAALSTTTATDWAGAFHPVVDDVTGLSIALTAGQRIQMNIITPAWTTLPNTPLFSASVYCE